MNRSDLVFDDYGDAAAQVASGLFGRLAVEFLPDLDGDGSVSDTMLAAARDAEALGPEHRDALAAMLLAHARDCFESTSYGYGARPGEDEAAANQREFGVFTPADAFAAAGTPTARICGEDDGRRGRYAVLAFYPPWEDEHGCGVVLRDGEPVGWGPSSVYVGAYEPDTP